MSQIIILHFWFWVYCIFAFKVRIIFGCTCGWSRILKELLFSIYRALGNVSRRKKTNKRLKISLIMFWSKKSLCLQVCQTLQFLHKGQQKNYGKNSSKFLAFDLKSWILKICTHSFHSWENITKQLFQKKLCTYWSIFSVH